MNADLLPPPDGNQNRTAPILGMTIGSLVLSCIFVGLRMYTRTFLAKSVGWDDWTMVAALVSTCCPNWMTVGRTDLS